MLRFSLKYGNKLQAIIAAAQEAGDEIPEPIRNAPVLNKDYIFYWRCFMDLSGDRQIFEGLQGPIPWTSIYEYCKAYDVIDELGTITIIIQRVDDFFCSTINNKLKMERTKGKKKK